MISQCRELCL